MTLEQAIVLNPYNPSKGNKAAYARYLRYNVTGWYELDNGEVQKLWSEYEFARLPASEQRRWVEDMGKAFEEGIRKGLSNDRK